jgi:hypothetical protein
MSMRAISVLAAVLLAGSAFSFSASAAGDSQTMNMAAPAKADSAKLAATRKALRSLWQGHIQAVRKVDVAVIAKDGAAEKSAEAEVVDNAHAIAGAIEPFYGAAARDQLFKLLAGHYGAVKAYLEAAIAKDQAGESKATSQMTSNAEEIATFLSGANPYLPKDAVLGLLQVHAGHHISQIQQLIAHDAAGESKTRKDMAAHMNVIADAIADALAKQFPAKF